MSNKELKGECKFCGQMISALPSFVTTQEEADIYASENCTCGDGAMWRQIQENKKVGRAYIEELFGASLRDRGMEPSPPAIRELLKAIVDSVAEGAVKAATVLLGTVTAKVMVTAKGELRVIRTKVLKDQLGG